MAEPSDGGAERANGSGVDRRQLLLVALCLCGLVVAAFLAPPPVDPSMPASEPDRFSRADRNDGGGGGSSDGGGGSNSVGTPRSGGNGSGDGGFGDGESDVVGESGDPIPVPGDEALADEGGCAVLLTERPVPGATVTVRVFDDVEPVAGAKVAFNGEPVGPTDDRGNATGRVPYNRTLSVTVDAGGLDDCEFYRERYDERTASIEPPGAEFRGSLGADVAFDRRSEIRSRRATRRVRESGGNATGEYAVPGRVNLTVRGKPYPGSTVTVRAHVEGVPMRGVAVTSDGQQVGQTDDRGRYRLRVPERDQTVLAVSRGDFAGDATVDVLLLEASVRPLEGLPFPGEPARANVTLDDSPKQGVGVSLGGRRLGSTTSDGVVAFGLPVDPGAAVTARTSRQVARVPVWRVYAPTIANSLFLLFLGFATSLGALRYAGPATARLVATGWSAVGVTFAAVVVGEGRGLLLALGSIATAGLYRHRHAVREGGEVTAGLLAATIRQSRRLALAITAGLERVLDRIHAALGRFASRIRTVLRSPRELLAVLRGFLDRIVTAVRLYVTVYRAGFVVLATAEIVAATARWQVRGFVASVAGLTCLVALFAAWRRRGGEPGPVETTSTTSPPRATGESVDAESTVVSLRGLYRRFARWVVPDDWRTRTPGEVSRAAVHRGFPREPVEALTGAFRDVEYGNDPPETRREKARAAFERLARVRERREEGDES